MPKYSMVTFSHTPYKEALRRGRRQDRVLDEILAHPDIAATWDSPRIIKTFQQIVEAWL